MNEQKFRECPEPETLVQFLQGKLQPPLLDRCEGHIKDCEVCHDTIAGLSVNDTLTERMVDAFRHDQTDEFSYSAGDDSESPAEIKNLLKRLTSDDFKRLAMSGGKAEDVPRSPEMEIIADRAAEVLRCVEHGDDSLGVLGNYSLIRLIGAGSTGVVFEAIDRTLERTVALKVLRPSLGEVARNRFVVEAKLAASIEHENIVTIFQVGQVDRLAYMAMSWIPGQTLEAKLASGKPVSNDEVVKIVRQIAAGLDAAHQKQLVHRDIKPANLWICEEGRQLKILDFGLARINDDNPNLTATGMLAGTPGFMSPEQTRGLELDGRSDLFSLGCVMYRLLTGKVPFGAPTVLATLTSIQNDHPAPPASLNNEVDSNLSDLTMSLLEKQTSNRPQSAAQTIQLLSTDREHWPIPVPKYTGNGSPRHGAEQKVASGSESGNGRWGSWIAAAIGLLILGVLGWIVPQIITVDTDQGTVVIKATDKNVKVEVLQNGERIEVIDTKTKQSFTLKSGQYSFNAIASEGGEENSFTIEPSTLTMKRGETAIVSVALVPNASDTQETASTPFQQGKRSSTKALYKGRPFDDWLQTALNDRDVQTKTQALTACAAIAETPLEKRQLADGTRFLARQHGDSLRYYSTFSSVFKSFNDDQVINFIRTEIAEGTAKSRAFCNHWMYMLSPTENPSELERETRGRIQMRAAEFFNVIAESLDKPEVIAFAKISLPGEGEAIIPKDANPEVVIAQMRRSKLGIAIKQSVRTASLQQRYELSQFALKYFLDDKEIFDAYRKDLFNPELDNATVEKIKKISFSMTPIKKSSQPWPVARVTLLNTMLDNLVPTVEWGEQPPNSGSELEARRISAAADLLAALVDAIDPNSKDKLLLRMFIEYPGLTPDNPETLQPYQVCDITLQAFHNIGQRCDDPQVKQSVIKTLERFAKMLGPEAREMQQSLIASAWHDRDRSRVVRAPMMEEIAFVMANLKGTPMDVPPNNSLLRHDYPKTDEAVSEKSEDDVATKTEIVPTPVEDEVDRWIREAESSSLDSARTKISDAKEAEAEKPFFHGKTFEQWLRIFRLERDGVARREAFEACVLTAETREETQQMLDSIRPMLRRNLQDSPFLTEGRLVDLLNACDGNHTIDFVKEELANGTLQSRAFCNSWLSKVLYDDSHSEEKLGVIGKRVPEVIDTLAERLEEPFIIEITSSLIALGYTNETELEKLQRSSLGIKVSELIRTDKPEKRLKLADLAFMIFPGDEKVWQLYEKDLLNPKFNDLLVTSTADSISQNREQILYERVVLLDKMLNFIKYPEDFFLQETLSKELEEKRMAAAARLLQKVVDGFLDQGEQGLTFKDHFPIAGTLGDELRNFTALEMTNKLLPTIKLIAKYAADQDAGNDSEEEVKKLVREMLEKLKKAVKQQVTDSKISSESGEKAVNKIEEILTTIND